MSELETAWQWRETRGLFQQTQALRVFHGPGEGSGPLAELAIDRFGDHFWVTEWQAVPERSLAQVKEFLESKSAVSAVILHRPQKGVPQEPQALLGQPPLGPFECREGEARFWIRMLGARHPGLFLDHLPLRTWLRARSQGWTVLNTFAYTGSLSVAAGLGGAEQVTTLDLAKPVIQWAQDNWSLNRLPEGRGRFIAGDVFEWLPRLKREGRRFDCIVLDPPSFSRGNKGSFSTAQDLKRLHELAFALLEEGGVVATSINSANVSWAKYEADLLAAAKSAEKRFQVLFRIDQPETFPSCLGVPESRYLKGFVLKTPRS